MYVCVCVCVCMRVYMCVCVLHFAKFYIFLPNSNILLPKIKLNKNIRVVFFRLMHIRIFGYNISILQRLVTNNT